MNNPDEMMMRQQSTAINSALLSQHQQQSQQSQQSQQQNFQQQQQRFLLQHQEQLQRQQFMLMQQHLSRFSANSTNPNPSLLTTTEAMQQQQAMQQALQQQQQQRNAMLAHNPQFYQQQQQQQQQKMNVSASNANARYPPDLEMMQQDAWRVCHPDVKRPFASLEDACDRLLPYHVLADYDTEVDDRVLDSDSAGQPMSRSQLWDQNILAKIGEFTAAFERQILVFNSISKRRSQGDFRAEERLIIEQDLLQDEKQRLYEAQAELEARKKAEEKIRIAIAQAEHARAEATRAEVARLENARAEALAKSRAEEHNMQEGAPQEHGVNMDEILHGWGTMQKEDDADPSEDFLNDDHDADAGEDRGLQNVESTSGNGMHGDWREVGNLDLNMR